MTKDEIGSLIAAWGADLPEKISGNEEHAILVPRMASLLESHRASTVALLRDWIGIRIPQSERKAEDGIIEARMWFALAVVREYSLQELWPDVKRLVDDIERGITYLPYYRSMVLRYVSS